MDVTVRVPSALRELVGGRAEVVVTAGGQSATVSEVLDVLARTEPALERRIRDERGTPRVHVNIFVGSDNVRDLEGLTTTLQPGQEISILPAISGG